jgi:hypothetical protein
MGDFEPEFAGKMNFYLAAVDDKLRTEGDNRAADLRIGSRRPIFDRDPTTGRQLQKTPPVDVLPAAGRRELGDVLCSIGVVAAHSGTVLMRAIPAICGSTRGCTLLGAAVGST